MCIYCKPPNDICGIGIVNKNFFFIVRLKFAWNCPTTVFFMRAGTLLLLLNTCAF